jgi:hypothetical protein
MVHFETVFQILDLSSLRQTCTIGEIALAGAKQKM